MLGESHAYEQLSVVLVPNNSLGPLALNATRGHHPWGN